MFVAWGMIGAVLSKFLRAGPEAIKNILVLIPRTPSEKLVWILLSLSAGFGEELIYRGYLLQQFYQWTGSMPAAIILQAAVYASANAALPWQIVGSVFFLGLLFGGVAAWRQTLAPGMIMHALIDVIAAFVRR